MYDKSPPPHGAPEKTDAPKPTSKLADLKAAASSSTPPIEPSLGKLLGEHLIDATSALRIMMLKLETMICSHLDALNKKHDDDMGRVKIVMEQVRAALKAELSVATAENAVVNKVAMERLIKIDDAVREVASSIRALALPVYVIIFLQVLSIILLVWHSSH